MKASHNSFWFTKLARTVSLPPMSVQNVVCAFPRHWVRVRGPPKWLLSDNEKHFTGRFIQDVHHIMGLNSLHNSDHSYTSAHVDRHNNTLFAGIKHHQQVQTKDWDFYKDKLIIGYATQMHQNTGNNFFEFVFSRPSTFCHQLKIRSLPKATSEEETSSLIRTGSAPKSGCTAKYERRVKMLQSKFWKPYAPKQCRFNPWKCFLHETRI